MEVWERMEGATALGHVSGTAFPGTFAHIVGGYAAGYYGYMWAEVIALDMLSVFGDTLVNPAVGPSLPPRHPEPRRPGARLGAGRAVPGPSRQGRRVLPGNRRRPGMTFVTRGN